MSDGPLLPDRCSHKDAQASAELLPIVYRELRQLAAARMANEPPGHTLQPTALVHEVWLRLAGMEGSPAWQGRAHFFGAAAEAMRRILVERARRRQRLKRGAGAELVEFDDDVVIAPTEDAPILDVHEALERLATEDPLKAEIVKLKFFAGLGNAEIAGLLSVNEKTIRRHWEVAKVRLFREIRELRERQVG